MTDFCKTAAAPWYEGQDQSVFESGSSKSLCSFFCSVCDVFLLLLKQNDKSAMWAYVCISKVQISDKYVFQFFIAIPMISTESKRPSVFLHSWCWLGSSRHIGLGAGYVSGTQLAWLKGQLVSDLPSWTASRVPERGGVTASISRDPDVDIPAPVTLFVEAGHKISPYPKSSRVQSSFWWKKHQRMCSHF